MQTDSEAVAYLLDLLCRHGLTVGDALTALAPPYWSQIERMAGAEERDRLIAIRTIYESAMLTGPFAILAAHDGGLFSVTDNTKLRPLAAGFAPGYSYFASEISALYEMEEGLERVATPGPALYGGICAEEAERPRRTFISQRQKGGMR